jgi:tetratricopeptide (TPR) repeat protein
LLDKLGRGGEALAQHEKAARLAPGDADIQLELARRYGDDQRAKAIAVLVKLAKRLPANVNVRASIAKLYDEWNELPRAIVEYEAVANLEPTEIDHAVVLGDAYWRVNDVEGARRAWARLAKIGTFAALQRQGEVLSDHDQWEYAIEAFTAAAAANPTSADPLRGRARARDALGRYELAAADARRAVALVGLASESDGLRERALFVRVLGHDADHGSESLVAALARWRFAFEHGDNAAGYLLAAHYERIGSGEADDVVVELHRRIPEDESLGFAAARAYAHQGKWARAKQELERIGTRNPKRADDVAALIEQFDRDRERQELEARLAEEGRRRDLNRADRRDADLVGRDNRVGVRLFLGSDVRNTTSALAGYGIYRYSRIAPATALAMRLEYWERDDHMEERKAFAFGAGFERRVLDLRKLEVAASAGMRFEVRYAGAGDDSSWGRVALGADAMLEVLPRGVPATIGLRWTQNLTDTTNGSTLAFELGFELR